MRAADRTGAFVRFLAAGVAAEDVLVCRVGAAQGAGPQFAVFDDLGVVQGDGLSGLVAYAQAEAPDEVLPEADESPAAGGGRR